MSAADFRLSCRLVVKPRAGRVLQELVEPFLVLLWSGERTLHERPAVSTYLQWKATTRELYGGGQQSNIRTGESGGVNTLWAFEDIRITAGED